MRVLLSGGCGYSSRTISPKRGNFRAVVVEKCCGSGCIGTVRLRRTDGWGFDSKIFVYETADDYAPPVKEWTHDPVVVWLSPNELEIGMDRVGHIYSQKTEARGIRITYLIGSVDHP